MSKFECLPDITFNKLSSQDNNTIFIEDSLTYTVDGELYRDYYRYYGVRIVFTVSGSGNTFSIAAVIL